MTTRYINLDELPVAAEILKSGGICAIPTETVYGLAADAFNPGAVAAVFEAKGRPADNPLIVHINSRDMLPQLAAEIPPVAEKLADLFWPGPLTMIFRKTRAVPDIVTAGLPTVAVRMPGDPVAREIIRLCGKPLAAPSANRSGLPSPTSARAVAEDMDGRIDGIVGGGECSVGVESTVLNVTVTPPRLLRPGGITPEMLEAAAGKIEIDKAVFSKLEAGETAASPGMKYRHYAPRARLALVEGKPADYINFVNENGGDGVFALCFDEDLPFIKIPAVSYGGRSEPATAARRLFSALRELDERKCVRGYAASPGRDGIAMAVYNRLIRACAFEVIKV